MIVITVQLKSARGRSEDKTLGVMEIWNDATGTETTGHYQFRIWKQGGKGVWQGGSVRNFPRKRLGCWDLMYRCFRSLERIVKENLDAHD